MAYDLAASTVSARIDSRRVIYIAISETDVQTASTGEIYDINLPNYGTIIRYKMEGDVNTVPKLGRAPSFTNNTVDQIFSISDSNTVHDVDTKVHYYLTTPHTLYLRTTPESNGHAFASYLTIVEGWI